MGPVEAGELMVEEMLRTLIVVALIAGAMAVILRAGKGEGGFLRQKHARNRREAHREEDSTPASWPSR